tara:strand:+ start:201 stop:728 length:528 start_codon:yes stop_codon:yes gene_type:complete
MKGTSKESLIMKAKLGMILLESLNPNKTDEKKLESLSDSLKAKFYVEFGWKTLGDLVNPKTEKSSVEVEIIKKDGTTEKAINAVKEYASPDLFKLEEKDIKKIAKNKTYTDSNKGSFERVERKGKGYQCPRCARFYVSEGSQMTDSGLLFHPDKKDKTKHCFSSVLIADGKVVTQ